MSNSLYLLSSLEELTLSAEDNREIILYVRVSSHGQKEDLNSQREYVSSYYPQCKCISDIGSGLNFKRKKFLKLMDDFMAVMHCFSSKLYFLRSYEKKIKSEIDKTDKES